MDLRDLGRQVDTENVTSDMVFEDFQDYIVASRELSTAVRMLNNIESKVISVENFSLEDASYDYAMVNVLVDSGYFTLEEATEGDKDSMFQKVKNALAAAYKWVKIKFTKLFRAIGKLFTSRGKLAKKRLNAILPILETFERYNPTVTTDGVLLTCSSKDAGDLYSICKVIEERGDEILVQLRAGFRVNDGKLEFILDREDVHMMNMTPASEQSPVTGYGKVFNNMDLYLAEADVNILNIFAGRPIDASGTFVRKGTEVLVAIEDGYLVFKDFSNNVITRDSVSTVCTEVSISTPMLSNIANRFDDIYYKISEFEKAFVNVITSLTEAESSGQDRGFAIASDVVEGMLTIFVDGMNESYDIVNKVTGKK